MSPSLLPVCPAMKLAHNTLLISRGLRHVQHRMVKPDIHTALCCIESSAVNPSSLLCGLLPSPLLCRLWSLCTPLRPLIHRIDLCRGWMMAAGAIGDPRCAASTVSGPRRAARALGIQRRTEGSLGSSRRATRAAGGPRRAATAHDDSGRWPTAWQAAHGARRGRQAAHSARRGGPRRTMRAAGDP